MSNRKNVILLLTLIVLGVFIIAVLSVWRDEARYATPIARADSTLTARAIGRAEFVKVDSFDIAGEGLSADKADEDSPVSAYEPSPQKAEGSLRLYESGYNKKIESFDSLTVSFLMLDIPFWTAPDSLAGKIVVPRSMPDSGDVPYLTKINDSTFAWLWLPGARVKSNVDAWK